MLGINPSSDPCGAAHRRAALDALCDAVDWLYGCGALPRSRRRNGLIGAGLSADLDEALADPIVQALMAADGTDRDGVEALMRCVAARLSERRSRHPATASRDGMPTGA
jgi:hypothetical protein